jgi:hypothetical protein
MKRFVILASVVVLAAASANCGNSERNVLSPSSVNDDAAARSSNKGGGKGTPGGGGTTDGSGSLTLVMYTDNNGNGLPNYGDTVTFNVSTTATTKPIVKLACYQGGAVVASGSGDFFDSPLGSWTQFMTLSSRSWTSGAADCTATLGYTNLSNGSFVTITSITFHVEA